MERPFFSIIIPTFNRPKQLAACLHSLERLEYPSHRREVIIVDDGGDMPLDGIVAPFQERLHLRLLRQANAGATTARNTGAAAARGDYLVFSDDDCVFAPDWLKALADRFQKSSRAMIGGAVLNALPDNIFSTASHFLLQFVLEYYNEGDKRAGFLSGNNQAMPALLFRAINGFEEMFPPGVGADDRELCDRWYEQGFPIIYAPEARIYHPYVYTVAEFIRQHFKNGRGAWYYHKFRAQRRRGLQVEPFDDFYVNLLRYPFRMECGTKAPVLSALLMLAQMANAVGYFWEKCFQD